MTTDHLGSWLAATPLADDGAPIRVPTPPLHEMPTTAPILGRVRDVDGVAMREVTFVHVTSPGDSDVVAPGGRAVMVHLNGLTDNHRENIEPALLQPVSPTNDDLGGVSALTYLLPDDGTWGYRLVIRDHIPHDVGAERPGWFGIHEDGRPDPLNPERLRHPHGEASSVLRMPASPRRDEWPAPTLRADGPGASSPSSWVRLDLPELPGAPGAVAAHHLPSGSSGAPLLVLFDAEQLVTMPLAAAMARYRHDVDVLLIESGPSERRATVLPHPELSATTVRDALDALRAHDGRERSAADVIVSGVSFGGLAAASVVVHDPSLAQRAIVQSGSFWFDPDREPRRDDERPGALVRCIEDGHELPGRRFVVHVGTDEGTMALGARQFAEAATARCADVSVRQYRGGHDWAWWSHALFDGLDELLD